MGVLNVTPDSFSDGGAFLDPGAAIRRAREMVAEGADILDVGGESSRPGAQMVPEEEELRRAIPIVKRLAAEFTIPVSIDTRKPTVAQAALDVGASLVNDVAANRSDTRMWEIVARNQAGYIAMHMQGTPESMQRNPSYNDVVEEVGDFFRDRLDRLGASGVAAEYVALDPGIGFGKTDVHNLALLARVQDFRKMDRPLLIGVSRKSFLGRKFDPGVEARLPGALACTAWCSWKGAHIFRAHDVAATVQCLRMAEALAAVDL
jgi:dihydropteroate synthase